MKNSDISIEIYNARPLSFKVNTENDFDGDLELDKIDLLLNTEFQIDEDNSAVAIKIILSVVLSEDESELFNLVSFFEFGVSDLKDVLIEKNKKNILVSDFARKLLNISIGGSRGMLSVLLAPTQYKGFTLPIANIPENIFD